MEKKNLSDLTFIIKNSGWVGSGQFSHILLRYIYTVMGTRLLGAALYGLFVIGRSVIQFSSILSEFGLGVAAQRQVAFYSGKKEPAKISQSIRLSILLALFNSIILAALIFFCSNFIAARIFKNTQLVFVLKLFSIAVPIVTLLRIFYNIFQGYKQIKYRIFLEYTAVPLANILLLAVLVLLGLKIAGIIWAFIFANLLGLLAAFFLYGRMTASPAPGKPFRGVEKEGRQTVKPGKETRKELLSYAAPLVFTSTLNFLQRWADTFLLAILSTGLAVGIYNVSLRVSEFVALPLVAFNMIFAPMIAEIYAQKDTRRLKFNYRVVTKLTFTLSLLIYSIILLFPMELLSVFGSEFKGAAAALVILCMGQLINASVGASGWMLVMTGHPKIELFNSLVFVVLTVLLNLWLIPRYHVLGAGIANAVTLSVVNLARGMQIYRVIRIHPFGWDYLKPLAAILVSVTMVFHLKKALPVNLVTFFLLVSVLVAVYVFIIFLLGVKPEERWILSQIKRKITARIAGPGLKNNPGGKGE